jgi:hypothetical protein
MESCPDLSTEAKCRELLDRYSDNLFVKDRLPSILRSQGRNDEANEILAVEPPYLKYDEQLLTDDERIRQNPQDTVSYLNRGIWHHWHGSFAKALADFDTSVTIAPTIAYAFCARASLRATCPDATFRNGQMALDDARTARKLAEQTGQLMCQIVRQHIPGFKFCYDRLKQIICRRHRDFHHETHSFPPRHPRDPRPARRGRLGRPS